ncbi:MAG: efflux RND transporter permease subunit, partial [Calditrichaeota bacterium]
NQNIPGGNIDVGSRRFNIKTSGSYSSLEDIRRTIVRASGDKILYLQDVANIYFGYADQNYRARFNGNRAVFVTANQKQGTNIFDVRKDLDKKLNTFKESLPNSISLEIAFDQSESVSSRVSGFFMNLLQGLILVGLVMFLTVGWRASIIVMIAIPTSIFIAIGFIDLADYGIQQMTIAGLIIALGLLVDNAIVVTENISRFIERGFSHREAATKGTSQIAWAVTSSTLTTVLAFIPMMMIGDVTGDFIRSMPVTVIITLLASLLISLTLTPYLSSLFLEARHKIKKSRIRKFLDRQIDTRYQRQLKMALNRPWHFIAGSFLVLFLSLFIFRMFIGISFFPKAEKPQFIININTPQGTSLDQTSRIAAYVDSVLLAYPEVRHFATNIGQGNPQIYYNVIPENEKSNHAQIFVELRKYESALFDRIIGELRAEFSDYPGARIEVKEFEQGPPVEAPVAIRITGDNLDTLSSLAQIVEEVISGTEGTINIENPLRTRKTDLHVRIHRAKAGMLGVPLSEVDRTVRTGISGLPVSVYRNEEGKEYNITVRLPIGEKPTIEDFDRIYVSSGGGYMIPLKQLASLEFQAVPMEINHYNMERNVTVTADVLSGFSVDGVTRFILNKLEKLDLPADYQISAGGELESRQESFGGMLQAVLLAIISIFAVLVLQFRSYSQPLIVFSAIPLAIVGSVVALLVTGNSFSFTAFVGFTSLIGIVVNNSIILVDYTNQLRADGMSRYNAIVEAGQTRFIPILLTTATTIGGLLPLTLRGGTLWAPMGWTIIGGLLASSFLTLMIVPILYRLFTKRNTKRD